MPSPAVVSWLSVFTLSGFVATPLGAGGVAYVESSSGLDDPELDGGYTEVEMADVDRDGNIDLVSVGDHGNPFIGTNQHGVIVWLGDGQGAWSPVQYGDFGYGGIAVGDVNGDGLPDIGYGIHHNYADGDLGDQILEVALGDGTGRAWTAWDDGLAASGEDYGMFGSDFADVDGDGDLDLGSISFGCCSGVHVYRNGGDGSWQQSFGFLGGNARQELTFGDVNGDGWPDLAVSHQAGTVYVGDGQGGFALSDSNLPAGGTFGRVGVSLGDVNGDGRDDLAWARGGGVAVWLRNANGTWTDFGSGLPTSGGWSATQLWDMDGDGLLDVAAFGNGAAAVWKGNGAGSWAPLASFTTPGPGTYAAFRVGGDADHNGRPDIVVVDDEGPPFNTQNHIHFYREASTPSALAVRFVRPGPAATLRSGAVRFVEWASAVPSGSPPGHVSLAYSLSGPGGPWTTIASNLPDNGRYQWTVPAARPTDDLRLSVRLASGTKRIRALSPRLILAPGHP
jgi:VCBS repeat protein